MNRFTAKEQLAMANLAQAYNALHEATLLPPGLSRTSRIVSISDQLKRLAAEYAGLKLPVLMNMPAAILKHMDDHGLISDGNQHGRFLVVGSAGFPAYEMEAGNRFMAGLESTADFDLSWKLPSPALSSVSQQLPLASGNLTLTADDQPDRADKPSLLDVIRETDPSFAVSAFRQHKLINDRAFEVDVLCARGAIFHSEPEERTRIFGGRIEPVEMEGQDILHLGKPLRHVMTGADQTVCPIVVPDPRCMALHKLWLSEQPDRSAHKRNKDAAQAVRLWQQCVDGNMPAYPIDDDFLGLLPKRWLNEVSVLDTFVSHDDNKPLKPAGGRKP